MTNSAKSIDYYADILRLHKLKATPQRSAIAEALDINGHLSIESLYELLKVKIPSISLATIYKNINSMIKNNFVAEVKLPGTKSVYELTKQQHFHLLCEKCGSVEDIQIEVSSCIREAENEKSFLVEKVDIVLTGRCSRCR